jgi:hypothetical protein
VAEVRRDQEERVLGIVGTVTVVARRAHATSAGWWTVRGPRGGQKITSPRLRSFARYFAAYAQTASRERGLSSRA